MNLKKKLFKSAFYSTLSVGAIYGINKIINCICTIDDLLSTTACEYYESSFGKVCYTKEGEGTPLLLIHDLNVCSSLNEWDKVVSELAKNHTVYALDLLGCGRSDKTNVVYTNYIYMKMLTEFIDNVIKEKPDVVATGDSASFVLMACMNEDKLINKIVMINPSSLTELAKVPTNKLKFIHTMMGVPVFGTLIYNIAVNPKSIKDDFESDFFYDREKIEENTLRTYIESSQSGKTGSKYLYASIKSKYTNANVLRCLNTINNNISIIVGNSNPEYALAAAQYENQIPGMNIITIEETKKLPQLEKPDEFIAALKKLLEFI
ncbi:alpha/beta fold hydrolase [Hespellia stercorisuis]|uniref:Pimeloyl-ACP methyl ester carboxylesterase n=1 Tax=Hespellia stercorisuis DSM 15480 TaxID=1121950 RepID=A0A1M6R7T5_9FIRM|nr:alpha/beta fold hydrolase [Hespellia stercorisuis]SHK28486.1 Pimeloyl-ACP methyl ester carboxylesterase [Hespellia stercorisuis DSM 15480]